MRRAAFNVMTSKIGVDNQISLRNYYRIADTLLKQASCLKERTFYKKKLFDVLDELEQLKPQLRQWLDELDEVNTTTQMNQTDGPNKISYAFSVNNKASLSYSNVQVMLQEAIAIVMAPTDTSSPYGIFHLSDHGGVAVIKNCQQRGFHPHEEPDNGSPIYEHCSHVYMNPNMKFDVVDLR